MARVREFDPQEAIQGAMNVFWRSGYGDTTMEDIVSETGVSRYGLYGTFGNKKDILLAAIRHYERTIEETFWAGLRRPDARGAEIAEHWQMLRDYAEDECFCNGCLIVNVAAEVAPHDPDIAAEVQRIDAKHAELFARAIRNGQAAGEIADDVDPNGTAKMLVALSRGGALMIRAGVKPAELEGAIQSALSFLRPPG
ncbi:MAG: TetR/AcrR family transcriptional regulator [Rhodospirillaceae bacterium]|nr:TetR/AcrR family transcriptional regulator [Rhodospirillaceae bacterium]MDD9913225.1 TetR/AcrR family transcriptional regulator [Rhodospirillaceae bacterium]MDD9929225.1 TetR/AcrR family transcriptional regulator [Rhodospirillaceae bacterium]